MEKSIENIWKQGFMDEKLIIPSRINDLYNKKSKLLFDNLNKTTKWDNLSLILIALLSLIFFIFIGKNLVGVYSMSVLLTLFYINKKHLKKLLIINRNDNCYTYLTTLRDGIKSTIKYYTILLAIASPIVLCLGFWLYYHDQEIAQETLIVGLTVIVLMPIISIIGYRLSNKILYGSMIKNLDTIIKEMNELKA